MIDSIIMLRERCGEWKDQSSGVAPVIITAGTFKDPHVAVNSRVYTGESNLSTALCYIKTNNEIAE